MRKPSPRHRGPVRSRVSGILLAGLALAAPAAAERAPSQPPAFEIRVGGYEFINPLLDCEVFSESVKDALDPFQYKLDEFVLSKAKEGKVGRIAVYFRDLNNGPWIGVNIRDRYSPVSLLKVPLLIGYLKQAETDPELLKRRIRFEKPSRDVPGQTLDPAKAIVPGRSYTVEELLRRMIAHSDNNASDLLFTHMDEDWFKRTHRELGLFVPYTREPVDYVTVKSYASFFRVLFNASYLTRDMSEMALGLLSESDFAGGLAAGVPEGTLVAHKFGERHSGEARQLHDCGIVYYPHHPYLLCVMTRDGEYDDLLAAIAQLSKLVYGEVDSQVRRAEEAPPNPASGTPGR